jgi:hypothetical protein
VNKKNQRCMRKCSWMADIINGGIVLGNLTKVTSGSLKAY